MKKEQNKKRNLVFLIVGVLTLLLAVVGATYAFFQAQLGTGKSTNVNVATGTTDNLTFTIKDINVTEPSGEGDKNIVDSHNKESDGKENAELVINANTSNFGKNGTSLGDGVEATATLTANDTTKQAKETYNVFLVLDQNDLVYTVGETTPELILTVTGPNNDEIKTIDGLSYHDKGETSRDVSGFDITGKRDVIKIAKDYEISVDGTTDESNLTTTQTWKVQVTLVNLTSDQNNNTGKSVTGKVIITTENNIELSNINTLDIERADTSITATAITEDSENISEYYFKIDGGASIATIALEENDGWKEETTSTHTFGS